MKTKKMTVNELREITSIKSLDENSKTSILKAGFADEKIVVFFNDDNSIAFVDNVFKINEIFVD